MFALIPARGGSKGIPRKNIVDVGGHPLIAYSIAACQLSTNISRVLVSTEDEEIAEVSRQYGAEVPFMRPAEHSQDHSTDVGFLQHFFGLYDVDEVALIRPTTPFRDPRFMDEAVDVYSKFKSSITGFRTVNEINENPYKVVQLENNIFKGFFSDFNGIQNYNNLPRQTFPKAYTGNGHIDIVKKNTLLTGTTFGDIIYGYVCDNMIDIDSQYDLDIARLLVNSDNQTISMLQKQIQRNISL
jgi:CMP-N,N'-diacetyllegionaminic acid synthase